MDSVNFWFVGDAFFFAQANFAEVFPGSCDTTCS